MHYINLRNKVLLLFDMDGFRSLVIDTVAAAISVIN